MKPIIEGNELLGGLFKLFGPPFLIICIAVAAFSFLVSKGKKTAGIIVGVGLVLLAIGWFASNFLS